MSTKKGIGENIYGSYRIEVSMWVTGGNTKLKSCSEPGLPMLTSTDAVDSVFRSIPVKPSARYAWLYN